MERWDCRKGSSLWRDDRQSRDRGLASSIRLPKVAILGGRDGDVSRRKKRAKSQECQPRLACQDCLLGEHLLHFMFLIIQI